MHRIIVESSGENKMTEYSSCILFIPRHRVQKTAAENHHYLRFIRLIVLDLRFKQEE